MEKKYKTVDRHNNCKYFDDINLVRNLAPDCDVFDISDGEVYLCSLSHKLLVYLGIEIADNFYKRNNLRYNATCKECMDLARKWVDDHTSVPSYQIESLLTKGLNSNSSCVAAYTLFVIENNYVFHHLCFQSGEISIPYDAKNEYLIQRDIFLNLIKSGKHLFLV
jgi:hypothetical protein